MTQTSKEYAQALFALSVETDSAESFSDALKRAAEVLAIDADYMEFLACYGIPAHERTAALEQVFSDRLPEYVLSFLQLLCENGHIRLLNDCVEDFEALYHEMKKLTTVKVTSAVALTDEQKARLLPKLEQLCKRQVQAVYVIDESIMGGMIIEADGKVLDASVKNRLHELKEVIDE